MPPRYTAGLERRVFSLAWKWAVMTLLVTRVVQGETEILHQSSKACQRSDKTLTCSATDESKLYRLDNFKWDTIEKVIIKNATELILEDPLCSNTTQKQEVEIYYSSKVTTESSDRDCSQQLILHYSRNVKITDGVDLVRMFSTEADEVDLPSVKQFDLDNSYVREVSVHVVEKQSKISGSRVDIVKKMVINGSFQFNVDDSTLERVEGFVYNSPKDAVFNNVILGSIQENGFLVMGGQVTIKNSSIKYISPLGLKVEGQAKLFIENSMLHAVAYNSLEVSQGGRVSFKNVDVVNEEQFSFDLSETNFPVFPFSLMERVSSWVTAGFVVLYVFLGLVAGVVSATVCGYFSLKSKKYKTGGETTELIGRDQNATPPHPAQSSPKNTKNKPLHPNRPLPDAPKLPAPKNPGDDEYQMYNDVASPPPSLPPPLPSSSEGGSTLPSATPKKNPKYPPWIPSKKVERTDDRDQLPPPPCLPEEEIYDELMDVSVSPEPKLPTSNKMKKPPIFKGPLPPVPARKY